MQTSQIPPKQTSALSLLVNPEGIRSSIKRLFRNTIGECIGELVQNSQRAGANNIAIKITPDGFSFQDDGHGILNGIDGFHTLLKLAESNFDNPTIEDQDPMGIGIVSLLTHDQVEEVIFASGDLQLSIDPARWWTESSYYSTWFERITTPNDIITGLLVYVRCKPELSSALQTALKPKALLSFSNEGASPVRGYEGILKVTLDGEPLDTSLPPWTTCREPLISTKYQGCPISIGFDTQYSRRSCVRWFGQLIEVPAYFGGFHFYLDVQKGRPVNPMSPSRAGLIQDAALAALLKFVEDQIFAFIFDPKNRQKIKAQYINACFSFNRTRSITESPYLTARQLKPIESPNSIEDAQPEASEPLVFTYEEAPLLIDEPLIVVKKDECLKYWYGLHSLLSLLDKPHTLQNGDLKRLRVAQLYWRPGATTKEFFHETGQFGISYTPDQLPEEWADITAEPVFAFNDPGTALDWTDLIVGTSNPIAFLQNEVWAAFSPSDDFDHDPQRESFESSCDTMIRDFMGNCVPREFRYDDFDKFLKNSEAVRSIEYRYRRGTIKRDGTVRKPYPSPTGLILHTSKNRKVRLRFY